MSVGLLLLRIVVGSLLIGHGTQKLFGWFGGKGLEGTQRFFETLGYPSHVVFPILAGVGEALGGLLIAIGFLTPLASVAVIGVMINAMWPSIPKGPWNTNGGYELPLTYAVVAAALAFTGPGHISVDHALYLRVSGVTRGAGALALGIASGALALALRSFSRPQGPGATSRAWAEVGRTHRERRVEPASSGNSTTRR